MKKTIFAIAALFCTLSFLTSCGDNPEITSSASITLGQPRNLFAKMGNEFRYLKEGEFVELSTTPRLLAFDGPDSRIVITRSEDGGQNHIGFALNLGNTALYDDGGTMLEPLCVFMDKTTQAWTCVNDTGKVFLTGLPLIPKKVVEEKGVYTPVYQ